MPNAVWTTDRRYLLVEQDDVNERGVPNTVVYDNGRAVWDRWSYEAGTLQTPEPAPAPAPGPPPAIAPSPGPAPPLVGHGRVIRVTDDRDGAIRPRMYSDLANAFVDVSLNAILVFCGTDDGPRFFKVDITTGAVERLGRRVVYGGETQGWSWDGSRRIHLCEGPRFRRVDPFNQADDQILLDISEDPQFAGCDLWQPHSSADGQVHSATVRRIVAEGKYPYIGTIVLYRGRQIFFPAIGTLDESQVTRDGRFVVIKETPFDAKDPGDNDNRIINLETRETRLVKDLERAVGHSDCGDSILIGEADKPDPGACVLYDLRQPVLVPRILFLTTNMGYVSYRAGVCLHSGPETLSLVDLNGAGLTPIAAHNSVGNDYDNRVKANLDATGRVACFMSNVGGRRDVFLLVL